MSHVYFIHALIRQEFKIINSTKSILHHKDYKQPKFEMNFHEKKTRSKCNLPLEI